MIQRKQRNKKVNKYSLKNTYVFEISKLDNFC